MNCNAKMIKGFLNWDSILFCLENDIEITLYIILLYVFSLLYNSIQLNLININNIGIELDTSKFSNLVSP